MTSLGELLIRPIAMGDLGAFSHLARSVGDGMTTVPGDESALAEKIGRSVASFSGEVSGPEAEYILVAEVAGTSDLAGCSALYPHAGATFGFYSYRRMAHRHRSKEFAITTQAEALYLTNELTGATEVGSLIVAPGWRGTGAAALLAKARYMMLAAFPERFSETIFAELRGYQDETGRTPFWEGVGERFFNMPFAEADRISAIHGNEFIADLMPRHPIYTGLLSEAARAAIGRPHASSAPAGRLLEKEGFRHGALVDVFDAGPQYIAQRPAIATVARARQVSAIPSDGHYLVADPDLRRFRLAISTGDTAEILKDCAEWLISPFERETAHSNSSAYSAP